MNKKELLYPEASSSGLYLSLGMYGQLHMAAISLRGLSYDPFCLLTSDDENIKRHGEHEVPKVREHAPVLRGHKLLAF